MCGAVLLLVGVVSSTGCEERQSSPLELALECMRRAGTETGPIADVALDDVEYAVLDAANEAVVSPFSVSQAGRIDLVVWHVTELDPALRCGEPLARLAPGARLDTIMDFWVKNAVRHRLEARLRSPARTVLLGEQELGQVFEEGPSGWPAFRRRHPRARGVAMFSRVGRNLEGTQALVYVATVCGPLCGKGWLVLLERTDDGWRVVSEEVVWISQGSGRHAHALLAVRRRRMKPSCHEGQSDSQAAPA